MRQPLRIERTNDRQIDQAQANANATTRIVNEGRLLNGRLAFSTDVDETVHALSGTPVRLLHGLNLPPGGTPLGWIVVDRDASQAVYRTAWDEDSITLAASGAVNARIWVFA